jgi:hypothetical protein
MKRIYIISGLVLFIVASPVKTQDDANDKQLQQKAQELEKIRQEIVKKQMDLLAENLEIIKQKSPESGAVLAMQAIFDLKISQDRVRNTLSDAKIIASDGVYLGRIGPTYDTESIFCSYGTYGASYSTQSIWCSYGDYGASYSTLSPFCSYSSNPPKIIVDGIVVATLTTKQIGVPIPITPYTLKEIFTNESIFIKER